MAKAPALPDQKRSSTLDKPAVHGLDAGRHVAERRRRRNKIKDRIISTIIAIVALGFVGVGAWAGYTIYEDQQDKDAEERRRVQAELNSRGSGDDLRDAIDELETTPKWNGPGNPAFGVGDDPDDATP